MDELRSLEHWLIARQQEADAEAQNYRESNPVASRNQYIRSLVLAEVWGEVNRRIAERYQPTQAG